MAQLEGRIAVVTGAASGIGRAAASRLAAEGATVILVDRNTEMLAEAVASLGGPHFEYVLDVTDETGWISLAEMVERKFGQLDILVNNAGYGAFKSIADTTLEIWRSIIAVNLDSIFLATKYLMPLLAKSKFGGSIINMSSIRGIAAAPFAGSYCAAKGGVRLFTKSAALECAALGNGIRVNSIHPGHVATPLTAAVHADEKHMAAMLRDTPIGRMGMPEDIADGILFLASDSSKFMTGAELVIDGGSTAQ